MRDAAMDDKPPQRLALTLHDDKPSPPAGPPIPSPDSGATLEERVVAALRGVFDPEIPVNIYELGLIYDLQIDPAGAVSIRMTLTSPACPVAGALPGEVQSKVQSVPGVTSAKVELVWEPPWEMSRMSEEARLQLGLFE
jgi:FeS assembly SUF system protein